MKKLIRFLSYVGAVCGVVGFCFGVALSLLAALSVSLKLWDGAAVIVMFALLGVSVPIVFEVKDEDWHRDPIILPGKSTKFVIRGVGVFLLLVIIGEVGVGITLQITTSREFTSLLIANGVMFWSWLIFALYVFGVRVIYSERWLAISRQPLFLFNRKRLEKYLKEKGEPQSECHNPNVEQ